MAAAGSFHGLKDLEAGPWPASALQTIEKYFTVTENSYRG